jgi:hypothetical protein
MRIRFGSSARGAGLSPYKGMMKWHHLLGLIALVFVATFIFSGLMSMGPWGIFNAASSGQNQINRYTGGRNLRLSNLPAPNFGALDAGVKEIQWHKISGEAYYSLVSAPADQVIGFDDISNASDAMRLEMMIRAAVPHLLPRAGLLSLDLLEQQDNHYYSRRNRYRPLPIYRAKFDDAESTWYHIDPATGELVNRVTDASRRERWVFDGLHSFDFQFLLQRRPLWDLVVISLSLIGFGFSLSAIVIAWRRLKSGSGLAR